MDSPATVGPSTENPAMDSSGRRHINAAIPVVVQHLTSAATLAVCIPKCQSLTGSLADGFRFVLQHRLGPIHLTFRGKIEMTELVPGSRYGIRVAGSGGLSGRLGGKAILILRETGSGTDIDYQVAAEGGGLIRLLGAAQVRSILDRALALFFNRFQVQING